MEEDYFIILQTHFIILIKWIYILLSFGNGRNKNTKERLYYFNPELNGYKWRVVWFRKGYNVKYLNLWGFMLQRQSAYKFVNEYLKKNPDTLFKLSEK